MKLYQFKTFTTSYYFPEIQDNTRFLYGLYSAYGGKLSKIYWWLFQHCRLVRQCSLVEKESQVSFPYGLIVDIEKNNSLMSFNMGSPGIEQKISILGYDKILNQPFFAKFAQKLDAKNLSRNEISVLKSLENTNLVPKLFASEEKADYIFFKTEYIHGKRPSTMTLNNEILAILIELSTHHLASAQNTSNNELKHCLSHGDFCPWNLLETEKGLKLIDWEMACNKPLGYDLFTYIFQTYFLFHRKCNFEEILNENKKWIRNYFELQNITDFKPYLFSFAKNKLEEEKKKNNIKLSRLYELLYREINKFDLN